MRVSCGVLALLACFSLSTAQAKTILKTEVVEEHEKSETKVFCSKTSDKDAVSMCERWLDRQVKTLGDRLLTSNCSNGDQTSDPSCLYKATGDVKYALKKFRTETERD